MSRVVEARRWSPPEQLIRASLLDGAGAINAWEEWLASIDTERIDPECARLYPLLYRSLVHAGVSEDRLVDYRRTLQRARFSMSRLRHHAVATSRLLADHRVPSIFLKGIAIAHRYYDDPGLRPMADFDLLVSRASAIDALRILEDSGWRTKAPADEETLRVSHGCELLHAGIHCDLHWTMMWEGSAAIDEEIWEHAVDTVIDGIGVRIPDDAAQLLHVIVHGTRAGEGQMLRWVPDSHFIVTRSKRGLDWGRFASLVTRHDLEWPVRDALVYLHEIAGTPIPDEVFDGIPVRTANLLERRVHSVEIHTTGRANALTYLPTLVARFRRMASGGIAGRLRWLATAFGQAWGVTAAHLPAEIMRRIAERLRSPRRLR